jgi:meso-butanediol dehydrogenase/(S,S)-butanediol dehydrogenase/diacetyl reductase
MTQNDNNRVAIVTGAAQGIGAAIARRLSKDGFDVVIADLPGRIADIKQMAETLSKGAARAVAAGCDVKSKADVEALVKTAVDSFGHLDVMVANAGIAPVGPFLSIDEKTMQDLVDVNIKGVLWCYQAAANQMIAQGTGGRLIGEWPLVKHSTDMHSRIIHCRCGGIRGLWCVLDDQVCGARPQPVCGKGAGKAQDQLQRLLPGTCGHAHVDQD